MNKTVTINISGIIFHIEEDAFEKLSKYLSTIKGYFTKTDGGNEIMADIEARIAEMLQGKTSAIKQVVLMADVDSVIETMGKPEEFADDHSHSDSQTENEYTHSTSGEPAKKRLFRDPDHKAVGGVCSGIAAYFDVDLVWIRLAMFLLIFFGGLSLWIYIILWIVIPEAKTTADRLAMKGERVDINNISKTVKEEAEQLKKRMQKYGNDLKNGEYAQSRNFFDKLADFLKDFFILFGKIFARLVGLVLLVFGIIFLTGFIAAIFGLAIPGAQSEPHELLQLIFTDRPYYTLGVIGAILVCGIPILMMFYGGIKLLFRITYSNKWINLSTGLLWLTGIIIVVFVSVKTATDFSETGRVKDQISIQSQKDTLYLSVSDFKKSIPEIALNEEEYVHYSFHSRHKIYNRYRDYIITGSGQNKLIAGYSNLRIIESTGDKFALFVIKHSQGPNKREAIEFAKKIQYKITHKDSLILFDDIFLVSHSDKFWAQDVEVILEVPKGKVVYLDKNMAHFIHDIENTTSTYDGDMVGRRWTMTKTGLKCIDCEGLDISHHDDDDVDITFPPTPPGTPQPPDINVEGKDARVKIGRDGINITSKDGDVKINKDGIHIDTKENKKEK